MPSPIQSDLYICEDVQLVIDLFSPIFEEDWWDEPISENLNSMSERLLWSYNKNDVSALVLIKNHAPIADYQNFSKKLTIDDTRDIVSKDHGYGSWKDVLELKNKKPDTIFELAVDCLIHGQKEDLVEVIKSNRSLLSARSTYGHNCTLLGYIAANGVELRRQITPLNLVSITEALLKLGADPKETIPVYDKNCSVSELVETSAHPRQAGLAKDLLALLARCV